jgi:ribonuclease Z
MRELRNVEVEERATVDRRPGALRNPKKVAALVADAREFERIRAEHGTGADVLVHEARSPRPVDMLEELAGRPVATLLPISSTTPPPFTPPRRMRQTRPPRLMCTPWSSRTAVPMGSLEGPFLGDARQHFSGPFFMGRDGDLFSLPAGGGELDKRSLLD